MKQIIAVETSDLVGSTKLKDAQLKRVMQGLRENLVNAQDKNNSVVEFYRGDAYQVVYKDAQYALRYAFLTKLFLLSQFDEAIKINQSIAIGTVNIDKSFTKEPLNTRMDPVFIASGRQLDKLNKGALTVEPSLFDNGFALTTQFFNRIITDLSSKQALVLYSYIKENYPEQKKIADLLSMTRQNVNTHLLRANADLIKAYIDYFETRIEGLTI